MDKSKGKKNHNTIPISLLRFNLIKIQSMDINSFWNLYKDVAMIDNDHNQSDKNFFIRNPTSIKKKWRRYDKFHIIDNIIIFLDKKLE